MSHRALLLVAFGPALTFCQVPGQVQQIGVAPEAPVVVSTTPAGLSTGDDWAPGVLGNSAVQCAKMPDMPQIFHAKRVFFSFFNTIVFSDRHNKEIGYVESWAGDWKNPFGYAGASFFVKTELTPVTPDEDLWNVGDQNSGNQPLTNEGLEQNEQAMLGGDAAIGHGNLRNAETTGAESGRGWFDALFRAFESENQHRLAAFIVGDHSKGGQPFNDEMTIRDCMGRAQVKASEGKLIFRDAKDAQYYAKERDTENELIVADLGTPPRDLVRVVMKEPCSPFPPFCARMGMWNWFLHGNSWEGQIVTKSTDNDMSQLLGGGDTVMRVSMSSGEAEDMRFVTLYSAYQFSNTRFSPFMTIVLWVLFLAPCFCMLRCCYQCCCGGGGGSVTKVNSEETQKLMETKEAKEEKKEQPRGFLTCCTRSGGRSVAAKE